MSHITEYGYWDYDHDLDYEPYGTVKWEAGDYDCMFKIHVLIADTFTVGHITLYGYVKTSGDTRGGTINPDYQAFYKYIKVYLGYRKGDVNGDEHINLTDVSVLSNYVLYETGLTTQYQIDAADVNGDGVVNIADVTMLTNMVLNGIEYIPEEFEEE